MSSDLSFPVLADRARITDLLCAYCDHVDNADIDSLLDLFTDDATVDMGHGSTFTGRAVLQELLRQRVGMYATTHHHCSNIRFLRQSPSEATIVSYLYVFHDDPTRNLTMHLWGRYSDEVVKEPDGWRFRVRRLRVAGIEETESHPLPSRFERFGRITVSQG